jgi:hypothetical protein
MQKYVRAWYKFCQNGPAKPVTRVFGADMGIGKVGLALQLLMPLNR